jgi:hypothetical protein
MRIKIMQIFSSAESYGEKYHAMINMYLYVVTYFLIVSIIQGDMSEQIHYW